MLERLTNRTEDGIAYTKIPANQSNMVDAGECYTGRIIDRIAAYEDTGLSPEEIINLRDSEFMGIVCPRCEQKISKGDVYCRHCSQRLN